MDIKFKTNDYVFSYRIAGICIVNGKVLLQKASNETGFAFPGGHVALGDTAAKTLKREFKEEIGVSISIGKLKWIQENFFPLNDRKWHQICLYYIVDIDKTTIPLDDVFTGIEDIDGKRFKIKFYWIPISELSNIEVYPTNCSELIKDIDGDVKHFVTHQ